jgi:NADH-quinone oxidoreductase subunit L
MTSSNLVYLHRASALQLQRSLMVLGRKADKWGHIFATLVSASTFVIGAMEFFSNARSSRRISRHHPETFTRGSQLAHLMLMLGLLVGSTLNFICTSHYRCWNLDSYLFDRVYVSMTAIARRFFAYLNFFIASDALAGFGRFLPQSLRGLGGRGSCLIPILLGSGIRNLNTRLLPRKHLLQTA